MSVSASIHFMENDNPLFVKSDQSGPVVSLTLTANQGNYGYVMLFFYGKRWNEFLDFMKPFVVERDNKLEMEEMNKGEVVGHLGCRESNLKPEDVDERPIYEEPMADSHGYHYEDPNR